jgi:putative ATP-dependent endonuclease of the OLD family
VTRNTIGNPTINVGIDVFGPVAEALGVIPDSRVKVLLYVEGPTDVAALKCLSHALHSATPDLPDLSTDERVAFIVSGGSTLKHWVNEHYLKSLRRQEVHIYDSDVEKYAASVNQVNQRNNGSWAVQTMKHEIECYLHPDAIYEAFEVQISVCDVPGENGYSLPKIFALAYSAKNNYQTAIKDSTAKQKLAEKAFPCMTAARLKERDPQGEAEGWFRRLSDMLH